MDTFERIKEIMKLKKNGLEFPEIAAKLNVSRQTINKNYLVGVLMKELREKGVDPSKYSYSKLRKMREKMGADRAQVGASGRNNKKKNEVLIEEGLNGLSGELKGIELYKGLSEKIFILMRKNRIGKYTANTQKVLIKLMKACQEHLINELQSIKKSEVEIEKPFTLKSEVIEIDWEER